MELHARRRRKDAKLENRRRKENFVIRFNALERGALNRLAEALDMSASETVRYLIRRETERLTKRPVSRLED
jgi:hypothetical protein